MRRTIARIVRPFAPRGATLERGRVRAQNPAEDKPPARTHGPVTRSAPRRCSWAAASDARRPPRNLDATPWRDPHSLPHTAAASRRRALADPTFSTRVHASGPQQLDQQQPDRPAPSHPDSRTADGDMPEIQRR